MDRRSFLARGALVALASSLLPKWMKGAEVAPFVPTTPDERLQAWIDARGVSPYGISRTTYPEWEVGTISSQKPLTLSDIRVFRDAIYARTDAL